MSSAANTPAPVHTIVYTSTLATDLDAPSLGALLLRSRAANAAAGITGLLLVRDRNIMQFLEGPACSLDSLYDKIARDTRHSNVTDVWRGPIRDRRFQDWSMGFDDLDAPAPDRDSSPLRTPPPMLRSEKPAAESPADYAARRVTTLRRAFVSGDRLTAALALILHAHAPTRGDAPGGMTCTECAPLGPAARLAYPCPTAQHSIHALEAAFH